MIALIDNYDSFTFNVYDYLSRFRPVRVFRNTDRIGDVTSHAIDGVVLSPGPSHPARSLLTLDAIRFYTGKVPILGICLGMQALALASGNTVRKARRIMHGKVDTVESRGGLLFKGIASRFSAVRYHSLVVDIDKGGFDVCAVSGSDGEVMAIENRALRVFGFQFHPESYATPMGLAMIENFWRCVMEVLEKLRKGMDLSFEEAGAVFNEVLNGEKEEHYVEEMLILLAEKGEKEQEIAACAEAMLGRAVRVDHDCRNVLDIVGTGGDGSGSFNLSTAAAIVCSIFLPVAKHGNRAASSKTGSADFLEALNVPIVLEKDDAERSLKEKNFAFLFAQKSIPP